MTTMPTPEHLAQATALAEWALPGTGAMRSALTQRIATALAQARKAALEEAAAIAETFAKAKREAGMSFPDDGLEIADEIRALLEEDR